MDYLCGKFGDCSLFQPFWFYCADKQTHRQPWINALLLRLSLAGVIKQHTTYTTSSARWLTLLTQPVP